MFDWRAHSRYISSSPFLKKSQCPRVHSCECVCIHEDSLPPIPPGVFKFCSDGSLGDVWLYFPDSTVRIIYLIFHLFFAFVGPWFSFQHFPDRRRLCKLPTCPWQRNAESEKTIKWVFNLINHRSLSLSPLSECDDYWVTIRSFMSRGRTSTRSSLFSIVFD